MFKLLKNILGFILVCGSVGLGLYVGVWLLFIGGIVQIVESFTAPEINSLGIAIGILKIMVSTFVGQLAFIISGAVGALLLKEEIL